MNSLRRAISEAAEHFETWGGGGGKGAHRTRSQAHTSSLLDFPKCLLCCWFARTNFFAMSIVSNVSVIDL